jgi:hypothetical protein
LTTRDDISSSQKGKLEEGISSLVVKKSSWKKEYHPL